MSSCTCDCCCYLIKQRICSTIVAVAAALFGFLQTKLLDPFLLRTRLAIRFVMQKGLLMSYRIAPGMPASMYLYLCPALFASCHPCAHSRSMHHCCRDPDKPYQQLRRPNHCIYTGQRLCNEFLRLERERRIPAAGRRQQLGGRSGVGLPRWQSEQRASRFTDCIDGLASRTAAELAIVYVDRLI